MYGGLPQIGRFVSLFARREKALQINAVEHRLRFGAAVHVLIGRVGTAEPHSGMAQNQGAHGAAVTFLQQLFGQRTAVGYILCIRVVRMADALWNACFFGGGQYNPVQQIHIGMNDVKLLLLENRTQRGEKGFFLFQSIQIANADNVHVERKNFRLKQHGRRFGINGDHKSYIEFLPVYVLCNADQKRFDPLAESPCVT